MLVLIKSPLMTSPLLEICKQKRCRPGIFFQLLKSLLSISIFDSVVATVIRETNILVIVDVFMKYYECISS